MYHAIALAMNELEKYCNIELIGGLWLELVGGLCLLYECTVSIIQNSTSPDVDFTSAEVD